MKGGQCGLAPRRVQPVCYHAQVWTILDELRSVALSQSFVQGLRSRPPKNFHSISKMQNEGPASSPKVNQGVPWGSSTTGGALD